MSHLDFLEMAILSYRVEESRAPKFTWFAHLSEAPYDPMLNQFS